ncbi:MAG: DUF4982 domain-containing protein, partial [Clostridia bacterium]|nr:DUF4982 domain-containing protein [Clostridia bacterium]
MSRRKLSLNSDWKFHRGDVAGDENMHAAGVRSTNAGILNGPAGKNYGDAEWRTVNIPHDFVNEGGFSSDEDMMHGYRPRPNAWYRKSFVLDESFRDKQLMLCFEGINVHCEIYFNGSLIERSFNGFQEIWVDITPRAYTDGRANVLAVYVKSDPVQLWSYEGGGIYRNVWLYAKEHLHIARDGFFVNPVRCEESGKLWNVEIEAELENSSFSPLSGEVFAQLSYKGDIIFSGSVGKADVKEMRTSTLCASFPVADPKLWDIVSPELYDFKIWVEQDGKVADEDSCRTGFRWFSVDCEKGFFLNGRNIKVNGACCHQDHGSVGIAVPANLNYFRVKKLKEMGANAYRCAHHMMDRSVYDACDEIGLMVADENRFFETRPDNIEAWKNQVRRNRNHPSIIFWSLLNEEPLQNTEEGAAIYRRLRSETEKWDKSRIFFGGMNGSSLDGAGLEMDISGKNYGLNQLDGFHKDYPNQPIIGSENIAAWHTRGELYTNTEACRCGGYDEDSFNWSNTIQEHWNMTKDRPWFAGQFLWSGFDYRGEPQPFQWPAVVGPYGMMDICGFEKNAFYFAKAMFEKKPFVKIIPHWNHKEGELVKVVAVSNCEEAELFLNGESLGVKKVDIGNQPAWEIPFTEGTLLANGYNRKEIVAEDSVSTAGKAKRIIITPQAAAPRNNGMDALILAIRVADKEGRIVPSASNMLHVDVEGDGYLIGISNGDPVCHETDGSADHTVFHGLCQAVIAVKDGAKSVKVTASGEGLAPAVYTAPITDCRDVEYIPSVANYNIGGFTMSEISKQPIDPLMLLGDNDVNSFMPMDIPLKNYQQDFKGGYRLYRSVFSLPYLTNGD